MCLGSATQPPPLPEAQATPQVASRGRRREARLQAPTSSMPVGGRRPLKPAGSAGPPPAPPPPPTPRVLRGWVAFRAVPHHTRAVLLTAASVLPHPARGRTLNAGQAQRPHVHPSVYRFACDYGSTRPALATAGAGLRRGGDFPESGGGDEGRTWSSPAPRRAKPEPRRSPAGAWPQPQPEPARSRNGGPRAPAAPEPRPVSPAGAALRGSLGRGAQSPKRARLDPPPTPPPPASWKFGARRPSCQGSQERGPRGKGEAEELGDLL